MADAENQKSAEGVYWKGMEFNEKNPAENCSSVNAAALKREGRKLTHRS